MVQYTQLIAVTRRPSSSLGQRRQINHPPAPHCRSMRRPQRWRRPTGCGRGGDGLRAGADPDVLGRLDDLVQALGKPAQLGLEAGQLAYDDLVASLGELRQLIGRRAALEEALRRRWAGELVDQPDLDDRLAESLSSLPSAPPYRGLMERAADAITALRSRGRARGAELYVWLNLALETRRELRRVGAQVEDLVARAGAQGVPVAAWFAVVAALLDPRAL